MARIVSDSINVPTAGNRVQISSSSVRVLSITFTSKAANAGLVYVGDVTVAAAVGIELQPGDGISLDPSQALQALGKYHTVPLNDFYVDAATNGDDVDFIALVE